MGHRRIQGIQGIQGDGGYKMIDGIRHGVRLWGIQGDTVDTGGWRIRDDRGDKVFP